MKKMIGITIAVVIVLIAGIVIGKSCFFSKKQEDPMKYLEERSQIKLDDLALSYEGSTYTEEKETYLELKIVFDESNLEEVKKRISKKMGKDLIKEIPLKNYKIKGIKNDEVIARYMQMYEGVKVKTLTLQAFISKEENGNYSVYFTM